MSENPDQKAVYFLGQDISQIPCFRNTFLYGSGTGFGVGLIHFMFTSKVRRSLLVCYGSFFVSSISYWFYCTYNYSKTQFELLRLQHMLEERMLKEGTLEDFSLKESQKISSPDESNKT